MRKIIHHLRNKPEEEKRHILHLFTFIGAVILIIFWTLTLRNSLASPETKIKIKEDLAPFSVLKDNIVDGYNTVKNNDDSQ